MNWDCESWSNGPNLLIAWLHRFGNCKNGIPNKLAPLTINFACSQYFNGVPSCIAALISNEMH